MIKYLNTIHVSDTLKNANQCHDFGSLGMLAKTLNNNFSTLFPIGS